jgi:hypothetical protein
MEFHFLEYAENLAESFPILRGIEESRSAAGKEWNLPASSSAKIPIQRDRRDLPYSLSIYPSVLIFVYSVRKNADVWFAV